MWQKNWNEFGLKVLVLKKIMIILATAMAIGHTDKLNILVRDSSYNRSQNNVLAHVQAPGNRGAGGAHPP